MEAILMCMIMMNPEFHLSEYRKKLVCKQAQHVHNVATKNKLEPEILFALIYVESGWNKDAVSHKGACGLTQVMPKYTGGSAIRKKYTCEQLKNPKTSISAGGKILGWWLRWHKGEIKRALCAYNAGFTGGKRRRRPSSGGTKNSKEVFNLSNDLKNKLFFLRKVLVFF